MTSGPELFFRYAQPPNQLGYCGPDDPERVEALATGDVLPRTEIAALAAAFSGAWPYLSLLAEVSGASPLDKTVVESYWLGMPIASRVDTNAWGNSVQSRFGGRAGPRWERIAGAIEASGEPSHAFHVFCVYPWVGLLREGHVEPSLRVLDQCRVSLGSVVSESGNTLIVRRSQLEWVDDELRMSAPQVELCENPYQLVCRPGDLVAIHWGKACQVLEPREASRLDAGLAHHLRLANVELTAGRLEPAR